MGGKKALPMELELLAGLSQVTSEKGPKRSVVECVRLRLWAAEVDDECMWGSLGPPESQVEAVEAPGSQLAVLLVLLEGKGGECG